MDQESNSGSPRVAIAVVVFCLLLLFGLRRADTSEAELNELLIHDLVSEHPRLLSGQHNESAIETSPLTNDSEPPLLSAVEQVTEEATEKGEPT